MKKKSSILTFGIYIFENIRNLLLFQIVEIKNNISCYNYNFILYKFITMLKVLSEEYSFNTRGLEKKFWRKY